MIIQDKRLPDKDGIKVAYDRRSKAYYYDISCALDTETTNLIIDDDHKYSWIYIFQIMIGDTFITCRTFDELADVFVNLKLTYGLNEKHRIIIYVHNLPFEFQFMRTEFRFSECLARKNRTVFKVFFDDYGIEFRDSLILSGMSLAKTAENLTWPEHSSIRKLKGDLDYNKIRLPCTPLTPTEMAYCYNDVKIICCYIDEQRKQYGDITKIPLTNTGRVRLEVKKSCFRKVINPKTHKKHIPYKNLMDRLTLEVVEYGYAKQAFLGGYTHANAIYSKKLLADVHSIDFTSSYPTVMMSEKYPMSKGKFIKLNMDSYAEFDAYLNQSERVAVVMVELWDIETKPDIPDDYISCSRLYQKGEQIMNNNGRVHKADYVQLIVTSVDLAQIVSCYNYSKIHIIDGYFYYVDYLPKEIIECVLEFYEKKTTLKGVKGKEAEYLLKKGMLNSCYGMCVTDFGSDEEQCTYNKGWETIKTDKEECVDQYNNNPNRFLFYVWGIFVTAYARNNLFNGIKSIGRDYVYCDTDSIKFLNMDAHKAYIEDYNRNIIRKCTECLEHWDLDPAMLAPKNQKGVEKPIGIWDYEGKYDHFKTNGCKRYLTEIGGEFDLTCAGLPENKGIAELTRNGTKIEDVFARFNDDFKVDAENSGKLAHFYNDDPFEIEVVDYLGNRGKISCNSCCVLFPVAFSVNGNEEYKLFLKYIAKLQG